VHLSIWRSAGLPLSEQQQALWDELFAIREAALVELEKARQAKLIGKALDAQVTIRLPAGHNLDPHGDTLRELLNVSQLRLQTLEAATETSTPQIEVAKAAGARCDRCWHWETDVGQHPEHPALCARCVAAVGALT
jgi:isoleucyl-tRNA synthetase